MLRGSHGGTAAVRPVINTYSGVWADLTSALTAEVETGKWNITLACYICCPVGQPQTGTQDGICYSLLKA